MVTGEPCVARAGAEKTAEMVARAGRASYVSRDKVRSYLLGWPLPFYFDSRVMDVDPGILCKGWVFPVCLG